MLAEVVRNGFNSYPENYNGTTDSHSKRSRASLIHDHIIQCALQLLPRPEFHLIRTGQRNFFSFQDQFLVQFKKLGANLMTSNYQTRQACLFEMNGTTAGLFGPEEGLSIINVGYVPKPYFAGIEAIFATHTRNQALDWFHQLDEDEGQSRIITITKLPPNENASPHHKKSRIRRIHFDDTATGTDHHQP